MKKLLMIMTAGLLFFSCQEESIPGKPYGEDLPDYIYFKSDYGINGFTYSWKSYGTSGEMATDGTMVFAVGGVYPYDRAFDIELVATGNKMLQMDGSQIDINMGSLELPDPSTYKISQAIIPAGETSVVLGFSFMRAHEYFEQNRGMIWEFDMVLTANEYFTPWLTGNIDRTGAIRFPVRLGVTRDYNFQ
ncbi:hypothetical protein LJB87_02535 [Alistipes sp. OttesenSCG-928-L06]|nr:hypothetical protein [Alistipes sp. OttesenSCG-928-L06]